MKNRLYRQEARSGIYQVTFPFWSAAVGMREFWPVVYGRIGGFRDGGLVSIFLQEDKMNKGAEFALRKSEFAKNFRAWERAWQEIRREHLAQTKKVYLAELPKLDDAKLKRMLIDFKVIHLKMWNYSIFIDMFDAGLDRTEVQRIQQAYGFSDDEVHTLLTPGQQSFAKRWEKDLALFRKRKISLDTLQKKYFWMGTDYLVFDQVDLDFVKRHLRHLQKSDSKERAAHSRRNKSQILRKNKLAKNPFEFYVRLAILRDERKKANSTGIYALMKIMTEVFRRRGVPAKLVPALTLHEDEKCFSQKINRKVLEARLKTVSWFEWFENGKMVVETGKKAKAKSRAALARLAWGLSSHQEIEGLVASRGFARGKARVIIHLTPESAKKMKKGDILITNMTRPEFVPLMKIAGAIVTDEGGLSSHAAIVARELGVPCLIGTKHATRTFKDGDLVEVDAKKGVIMKVS